MKYIIVEYYPEGNKHPLNCQHRLTNVRQYTFEQVQDYFRWLTVHTDSTTETRMILHDVTNKMESVMFLHSERRSLVAIPLIDQE